MDSLPDKFEFDLYLKRFLYSIMEQKKPLTTDPVSPKSKNIDLVGKSFRRMRAVWNFFPPPPLK